MFEFKTSYFDKEYHKPGETPFFFPPLNTRSSVDSNLIEIRGKTGSGKTTLLNIFAIALNYLEQEKNLEEKKPILKRKLDALKNNDTLDYTFHIVYNKAKKVDLAIQQKNGVKTILFDSRPVDPDFLQKTVEVAFLTEDDPEKVITASRGKLERYFRSINKKIDATAFVLSKHIEDIKEYNEDRIRVDEIQREIEQNKNKIQSLKGKIDELNGRISAIKERDQYNNWYKLLKNEENIVDRYKEIEKKYEKFKKLKNKDPITKIKKVRDIKNEMNLYKQEVLRIINEIRQFGLSLRCFYPELDIEKMINDDWSQFSIIYKGVIKKNEHIIVQKNMAGEIFDICKRYPSDEMVPVIDQPAGHLAQRLSEFVNNTQIKSKEFEVVQKLSSLKDSYIDYNAKIAECKEKIDKIEAEIDGLENYEEIQNEYKSSLEEYAALQEAKNYDWSEIYSKWLELRNVHGDIKQLQCQKDSLDADLSLEEAFHQKNMIRYQNMQEKIKTNPKYLEKEKELKELNEELSNLLLKINSWINIIHDPKAAKDEYKAATVGFKFEDYNKFVDAVGFYLGKQFEPIPFADSYHKISFFNIEEQAFITTDDRKIRIDMLSTGQQKLTSLIGSLKNVAEGKQIIVLIDEIEALDPEKLADAKNKLKELYDSGKLLLAILVRPIDEDSPKKVEIMGF
uniref:Uncharacterized protein n=1 Tax=Candidatus Methanomethylicus mesodigestus TaxID=1867258 RepID=A0A7C3EZM1_9CREN